MKKARIFVVAFFRHKNSKINAMVTLQMPALSKLIFCCFLFFSPVQLNKYETAPNFIHISQNLTSDCLLI